VLIRKAEWLGNGAAPSAPTSAIGDDVPPAAKEIAAPIIETEIEIPPLPLAACEIETAPVAGDVDSVLPARAIGEAPADDIAAEQNEREVSVVFGDRRYR